jgi:hypothetical protein
MNKVLSMLVIMLGVCFITAFMPGCNQQQINVVSQQAGIVAVATWMSVDNPTDEQKVAASGIVALIKEKSSMVVSNTSYYSVLMPLVNDYIATKVQPKDRLICRLAGGWVLTGIDTLMAMNPSWMNKQAIAAGAVNSFCDGTIIGLGMTRDNPVIQAAMKSSAARARILEMEDVRKRSQVYPSVKDQK